MNKAIDPKIRFERKFTKASDDDCWLWTAAKYPFGHGRLIVGSRKDKSRSQVGAHRFSYELYRGPIPKGLFVLHKCNIPSCVNPGHLYLGTQKDNVHDAMMAGKHVSVLKRGAV